MIVAVDKPTIIPGHDVSPTYYVKAADAYHNIPEDMRDYFKSQGVSAEVGKIPEHLIKDKAIFAKGLARGVEEKRNDVNQVAAWFDPNTNKVAISQDHQSIHSGKWTRMEDLPGTVRHEYGHAFSHNAYDLSDFATEKEKARHLKEAGFDRKPILSSARSFQEAYEADLAAMGASLKQLRKVTDIS